VVHLPYRSGVVVVDEPRPHQTHDPTSSVVETSRELQKSLDRDAIDKRNRLQKKTHQFLVYFIVERDLA
jgi:hypothetical protein